MRKNIIILLAVIFAVSLSVTSAACKIEPVVEEPVVEEPEELVIRVVYHNTGIVFAQLIKAGVDAAAEELGIDAEMTGPVEPDVEEQVRIIEDLITLQVDGLAISNVSAEALNPIIKEALEAEIPTVSFNSDASGSERLAFYGQDLVQSGRTQAEILVEYMGTEGEVLIFSCDAAAAWSNDREQGVREGLEEYPDIEIVGIVNTGVEEQACYAAIESALLANPNLKGAATLDAVTTPAFGRALLRENLAGKIYHVGHDLLPETLDNIAAGATNASLSQDPFKQGYLPVKALYDYIVNGIPLESGDTGVLRVDETNIDEYIERLEKGEPIG